MKSITSEPLPLHTSASFYLLLLTLTRIAATSLRRCQMPYRMSASCSITRDHLQPSPSDQGHCCFGRTKTILATTNSRTGYFRYGCNAMYKEYGPENQVLVGLEPEAR